MRVIREIAEMQAEARANLLRQAEIGFVPTMGALHAGHGSLIQRAAEENEVAVVSIFVNPTQFNDPGDFERYPRTEEEDIARCEEWGADIVFIPTANEMYPAEHETAVMVPRLADHLCGLSRGRGHFIGVCTVVSKLFHIVQPVRAYFGQKDMQQALIIRRMVADLNFPLEIVICPTVREEDGLAMSSRNRLIPPHFRPNATALYRALCLGRDRIRGGERDVNALCQMMAENILQHQPIEVDYLSICSLATLEELERVEFPLLLAGAVVLGGVRLIDNIPLASAEA